MSGSWDAAVFDKLYANSHDPWHFETSDYEREKYDATLAALPAGRFCHALEVGCSIGVLTARLAERCDRLLALDLAQAAVARTRERCAAMPNIVVQQRQIPGEWPQGETYDLILFSEVLYFLSAADVARSASLARGSLAPGGRILLVNWTGETNTPTTGDQATKIFGAGYARVGALIRETYRIDLLRAG